MSPTPHLPRRRSLLVGGAALATTAATPALFGIARAQGGPIKIGFPVPLTGAFSAEAQDQVRAAELAVKEWNAAGGHKGQMAELLVRDDKLNPGEAATRTLELIEKDKVNFVVGSLSAATQLSINAVTRERKVLFNSISQSDTINEAKDWSLYTFHEALNPHLTAGAVARYAFPKFGKKIVYLTADYAYGHEMVRGFQRAGAPLGAQTLADIRHPLGAADYSAFLPRIQSLKPDVLVLCNFGRDLVNSAKQATDFGLKQGTKIITPVLLFTSRVAGGADAFEGRAGRHQLLLGHGRQDPQREEVQRRFPQGLQRRRAVRLRRAGLRRHQERAAGGEERRRHRFGARVDRTAPAEVRLVQGPAVVPQVRPPVGAERGHRREQEQGHEGQERRLQRAGDRGREREEPQDLRGNGPQGDDLRVLPPLPARERVGVRVRRSADCAACTPHRVPPPSTLTLPSPWEGEGKTATPHRWRSPPRSSPCSSSPASRWARSMRCWRWA
jgi:ABC-type branched-subunit amino acid transport system substrate-binding protein